MINFNDEGIEIIESLMLYTNFLLQDVLMASNGPLFERYKFNINKKYLVYLILKAITGIQKINL